MRPSPLTVSLAYSDNYKMFVMLVAYVVFVCMVRYIAPGVNSLTGRPTPASGAAHTSGIAGATTTAERWRGHRPPSDFYG